MFYRIEFHFTKKENNDWIAENMGDELKFSSRKVKVRPFVLQRIQKRIKFIL